MKRVLLLLPTTGYRNAGFLSAANKLGIEIVAAANHCHQLAAAWGLAPLLALHFDQPDQAADEAVRALQGGVDAVLAVDDSGVELAALLRERLGLPGNPARAVRCLRDKLAFRRLLRESGLPCPGFRHLEGADDARSLLTGLEFPVVVKARRLSGSRGVIRADDPDGLLRAVNRVRAIQARADRDAKDLGFIVEDFIPGSEHSLEGILRDGALTTLALFDKPDPLNGPYFEETIYVTPSRLPAEVQARIARHIGRACEAAGIRDGPVHAEVRFNERGIWVLEVAARSIGGLCSRVLTHSLGMSMEELILRQALAMPLEVRQSSADAGGHAGSGAAGVMMIPIPRRGIYRGIEGLEAAHAVPGITGISITAEPGHVVAPPPEGAGYLGFIFSRAEAPAGAEMALRLAHRWLQLDIRAEYPATVDSGAQPARERTASN